MCHICAMRLESLAPGAATEYDMLGYLGWHGGYSDGTQAQDFGHANVYVVTVSPAPEMASYQPDSTIAEPVPDAAPAIPSAAIASVAASEASAPPQAHAQAPSIAPQDTQISVVNRVMGSSLVDALSLTAGADEIHTLEAPDRLDLNMGGGDDGGADKVIYRVDARSGHWIAYDGGDTVLNFKLGQDSLVFRGFVYDAADFSASEMARSGVSISPMIEWVTAASAYQVTGIVFSFSVSGKVFGSVGSGNRLTIKFAESLTGDAFITAIGGARHYSNNMIYAAGLSQLFGTDSQNGAALFSFDSVVKPVNSLPEGRAFMQAIILPGDTPVVGNSLSVSFASRILLDDEGIPLRDDMGNHMRSSTIIDADYENPLSIDDVDIQWLRFSRSGEVVKIAGATNKNYTVTYDDLGTFIRASISYAAQPGSEERDYVVPENYIDIPRGEITGLLDGRLTLREVHQQLATPIPGESLPSGDIAPIIGSVLRANGAKSITRDGMSFPPETFLVYWWSRVDADGNVTDITSFSDGFYPNQYVVKPADIGFKIQVGVRIGGAAARTEVLTETAGVVGTPMIGANGYFEFSSVPASELVERPPSTFATLSRVVDNEGRNLFLDVPLRPRDSLDYFGLYTETVSNLVLGGDDAELFIFEPMLNRVRISFNAPADITFLEHDTIEFTMSLYDYTREFHINIIPREDIDRTVFLGAAAGEIIYDLDDFDNSNYQPIAGRGDNALFTIAPNGDVSFKAAVDVDTPQDANMDNIYEIHFSFDVSGGARRGGRLEITLAPENIIHVSLVENNGATAQDIGTPISGGGDFAFTPGDGDNPNDNAFGMITQRGQIRIARNFDFETREDFNDDNVYEFVFKQSSDFNDVTNMYDRVVPYRLLLTIDGQAETIIRVSLRETAGTPHRFNEAIIGGSGFTLIDGFGDNALATVSSEGRLSVAAPLDYETPQDIGTDNDYHFAFTGMVDGEASRYEVILTIENVIEESRVFFSGDAASMVVFDALLAAEASASFTLDAEIADNGLFRIESNGELFFKASPDYSMARDTNSDNIYVVEFATETQAWQVSVRVRASDEILITHFDDRTNVIYQLPSGSQYALRAAVGDYALFMLSGDGMLRFNSEPDFDAPQDSGSDNIYELSAEGVVDGLMARYNIRITVAPEVVSVITGHDVNTPIYDAEGDGVFALIADTGDNEDFMIDKTTGEITFKASPDDAMPIDSDMNSVYRVSYTHTQTDAQGDESVTTNTIDVNISAGIVDVYEQHPLDKAVYTIDAGDQFTLIDGFGDNARFHIDGDGDVFFRALPDFETPADANADGLYNLRVSYRVDGNLEFENFNVRVNDLLYDKDWAQRKSIGPSIDYFTYADVEDILDARGDLTNGYTLGYGRQYASLMPYLLWGHYLKHPDLDDANEPLILTWSMITPDSSDFERDISTTGRHHRALSVGRLPSVLTSPERIEEYRYYWSEAFDYIASFINVKFVEVEDNADSAGDIRVDNFDSTTVHNTEDNSILGLALVAGRHTLITSVEATAVFGTYLHEIGHILGLNHPFNVEGQNNRGFPKDASLQNSAPTVMSYAGTTTTRENARDLRSLTHHDLRALQFLYGAKDALDEGYFWRTQPDPGNPGENYDVDDPPTAIAIVNAMGEIVNEFTMAENTDTTTRILLGQIRLTDIDRGSARIVPLDNPHLFQVVYTEYVIDGSGGYYVFDLYLREGVALDYETTPILHGETRGFDFGYFVYTATWIRDTAQLIVTDMDETGAPPIDHKPTKITINIVQDNRDGVFTFAAGPSIEIKIADIILTDDGLGTNEVGIERIGFLNSRRQDDVEDLFEIRGRGDNINFELWLNAGHELTPALTQTVRRISIDAEGSSGVGVDPDSESTLFRIERNNPAITPLAFDGTPLASVFVSSADSAQRLKLADFIRPPAATNAGILLSNDRLFEISGNAIYLKAGVERVAGTYHVQIASSHGVRWNNRAPPLEYTLNIIAPPTDARPSALALSTSDVELVSGTTTQRTKLAEILVSDDGVGRFALASLIVNSPFTQNLIDYEITGDIQYIEITTDGNRQFVETYDDSVRIEIWLKAGLTVTAPPSGTDAHTITFSLLDNAQTTTGNGTLPDSVTFNIRVLDSASPNSFVQAVIIISENTPTHKAIYDTNGSGYAFSDNYGDNALFTIDNEGRIFFRTSPDFETPVDAQQDNTYQLEVSQNGGNLTRITIVVEDLFENDFDFIQRFGVEKPVFHFNHFEVQQVLENAELNNGVIDTMSAFLLTGEAYQAPQIGDLVLTWSFITPDTPGSRADNPLEGAVLHALRAQVQSALDKIAAITHITFHEVTHGFDDTGDINIYTDYSDMSGDVLAQAFGVDPRLTITQNANDASILRGFATLLGLKDPDTALDRFVASPETLASIMNPDNDDATLTQADIRALRQLYGGILEGQQATSDGKMHDIMRGNLESTLERFPSKFNENIPIIVTEDPEYTHEAFLGFITADGGIGNYAFRVEGSTTAHNTEGIYEFTTVLNNRLIAYRNQNEIWLRGGEEYNSMSEQYNALLISVLVDGEVIQKFELLINKHPSVNSANVGLTLTSATDSVEENTTISSVPVATKLTDITVTGGTGVPTLTADTDTSIFEIREASGRYSLWRKAVALDYEVAAAHSAGITFAGEMQPVRYFHLAIENLRDEVPIYAALLEQVTTLQENIDTSAPITLGRVSVIDYDNFPIVVLASTDAQITERFELIDNVLRLKAGAVLDYETAPDLAGGKKGYELTIDDNGGSNLGTPIEYVLEITNDSSDDAPAPALDDDAPPPLDML